MSFQTGIMPTVAQIKDYSIIIFPVSKIEVRSMNFQRIDIALQRFNRAGRDGRGKLMISFDYNDVKDEIYEIPEIRKFVEKLFFKYSNMFYFITKENGTWSVIFSCLCDLNTQKNLEDSRGDVKLILSVPEHLRRRVIEQTTMYGVSVGDDTEEAAKYAESFFSDLREMQ